MPHQDNFYVHLPSNNRTDFEANSLGRYTTHLKIPIQTDSAWEVALTEISYTMSWYNLHKESSCSVFSFRQQLSKSQFKKSFKTGKQLVFQSTPMKAVNAGEPVEDETVYFDLHVPTTSDTDWSLDQSSILDDETVLERTASSFLYSFPIRAGFYTSKDLLDNINTTLLHETSTRDQTNAYINAPHLEIGPDGLISSMTGRTKVTGSEDTFEDTFVNVSGEAAEFLGFYWDKREEFRAINTNFGKKYKVTSSQHPQVRRGVHALYVYSDIIRSVRVGDTMSNLLRIVEVPDKSSFGDQITLNYVKPQYKMLASNEITSIEILITDGSGERIPFRFGRTIVTLHFRRC